MLLLDGTPGADISPLLIRLQEEATLPLPIMLYEDWQTAHTGCNHHHDEEQHPEGIIYLRVLPEIAYARMQKRAVSSEASITLDNIKQVYAEKERFFIENSPQELQHLPVLVLNGNIDFQTDFAQFYNHLFYIRRFIKQIQDKKDLALGIYKEKAPHRHCC